MNRQLENKRALVTGGSRDIGGAVVRRLARTLGQAPGDLETLEE